MMFPFEVLSAAGREVGLVVGVLIGFAFGFVLERAGFGRADKLVGQFYGNDMTVLKVMFTGIVTAMLGIVILDGVGIVDLRAVSDHAASITYLWPMLVGGLLLGVGFVVSGYCPGTSIVAMASGKIDGLFTVVGVIVGSVAMGELQPALGGWFTSGDLGNLYLYDLVGVPPMIVALAVTAMALAMFAGGERIERWLRGARAPAAERRPRLAAWGGLATAAVLGLATLLVPARGATTVRRTVAIDAVDLARRVVSRPWSVRVLDLREKRKCVEARVPGAECTPAKELGRLELGQSGSTRDLVLVGDGDVRTIPAPVVGYPGRVHALRGGFSSWRKFALTAPAPPGPRATAAEREVFRLRSGLHAAFTGVRAPPPPPPSSSGAPRRRGGGQGGCS